MFKIVNENGNEGPREEMWLLAGDNDPAGYYFDRLNMSNHAKEILIPADIIRRGKEKV